MKDWEYKKQIEKIKEFARKRGWKVKEVRVKEPVRNSVREL